MRPRRSPHKQKPKTVKQRADERLAQALRNNLHRRKAQARARASASVTNEIGTIPPDEKSSFE